MSLPKLARTLACLLVSLMSSVGGWPQVPVGPSLGGRPADGAGERITPPPLRPPGQFDGTRPERRSTAAARFGATSAGSKPDEVRLPLETPVSLGVQTFPFAVGRDIPDGSLSGLTDTRVLSSTGGAIRALSLSLTLTPLGEGGFLGDLYATLVHDDMGYAVLLNRPGRGGGSPFGYNDDVGVSITFAADAPADIHRYRQVLSGSDTSPLTGNLTGSWQPDGRAVDPLRVTAGDDRNALLEAFLAADPGGRWTLFIADVSPEGAYRLDSWNLTLAIVPEPPAVPAVLGFVGALIALAHRRTAAGPRPQRGQRP